MSATAPATWGAAMLVPDTLAAPPPGRVEGIPTEVSQSASTSSSSSPGAEMVTPLPVWSIAPEVVKNDAVSAAMSPYEPAEAPWRAVVLATAMTSEKPAGTTSLTFLSGSFPAATTIAIPELTTAWIAACKGPSNLEADRPKLMLTTLIAGSHVPA